MAFVFSKILDHGASHPVVARLQVQTGDLLKQTSFSENDSNAIFQASFDASLRLIACCEILEHLLAESKKVEQEHRPSENPQAATIPHITRLRHNTETFLYEAKNFLRDLTGIINATFGTDFTQASALGRINKPNCEVASWAEQRFGSSDRLTTFFKLHQDWISEVVQMRNAVEHPNGRSGVLHIKNYELMPDGSIRRPVWCRNADSPSRMLDEMPALCEHMLVMAEELVALIVERHLDTSIMQLYEVPDEQQKPECPIRFKVGLTEEVTKKLAEQTKRRT